jgi:hypothetical protein
VEHEVEHEVNVFDLLLLMMVVVLALLGEKVESVEYLESE